MDNKEIEDFKKQLQQIWHRFTGKQDIDSQLKCKLSESELESVSQKIFQNQNFDSSIINEDVKIDLEMFEGLGIDKKYNIFEFINQTHTKTGKYLLQKIFGNPISDIQLLRQRQDIINKIFTNSSLYQELDKKLEQIGKLESSLLWFWKDLNDETHYLYNMVYFKNKYLKFFNTHELAMRMYNYYVIILSPLYGMISPIMMVLAPFIMIKFYFKTKISLQLYIRILKQTLSGFSSVLKMNIQDTGSSALSWTSMISILIWLVFYIHGLCSNLNNSRNTNKITNDMHKRLNQISELVKEGHCIYDLLGKDIPNNVLYAKCSVEPHFKILWNPIFQEKPSKYSNKGLILKTFKILQMKKDLLLELIQSWSNLDCFVSIAKLMKNTSHFQYTFPEYIYQQKHPSIECEGLAYPILSQQVVLNNINLGLSQPRNAIITGPNAGGKSTFIKSLCLAIIFGQTLGIVPAHKFKFTPFSLITTYLNIPDSKGKESLYEAEMRRSLEYINIIEKLPKKEFSFVIMDEIFSSTNPEEGIAGAYAIANNISKHTNNMTLLTTHFSYLSKLEKTGKFRNYKIPITRDENNNIVYQYKLEPGISNQFIALELLKKKGFDKNIVTEALDICEQLKKHQNYLEIKSKDRKKKVRKKYSKSKFSKLDANSNKNKSPDLSQNMKLTLPKKPQGKTKEPEGKLKEPEGKLKEPEGKLKEPEEAEGKPKGPEDKENKEEDKENKVEDNKVMTENTEKLDKKIVEDKQVLHL